MRFPFFMLVGKSRNVENKKIAIGVFATVAVFLFFMFGSSAVFAQSGDTFGVGNVGSSIALAGGDIRVIAGRIIQVFLGLLGIVALGLMLYAGFVWMTSGGNEEKIVGAKRTMINATIGLAIILSAFGIVSFVMNALLEANGIGGGEGGSANANDIDSFVSGGALGTVIRDHYPLRNETDVRRNTRIAVTFSSPMDPGSIIVNTNNTCWGADGKPTTVCDKNADGSIKNPYYGDCLPVAEMNWVRDCDTVSTSSVRVFTGTTTESIVMAGLVAYEPEAGGQGMEARTFVFRPHELLGSADGAMRYTVELRSGIKRMDGVAVFSSRIGGKYVWRFDTGVTADFTPPEVVDVYPNGDEPGYRNSVVQIRFSEPMDPTVLQGGLTADGSFTNLIFHSASVSGRWRLTDGYKTAEFVSNETCGTNSCGDVLYCLPVSCTNNADASCVTQYTALARTADLLASSAWESRPFTGIADMAGNALDGDADGVKDDKPEPVGAHTILDSEKRADNFSWQFRIQNSIDRVAPVVTEITPNVDAEGVSEHTPLTLNFNRRMWFDSVIAGVRPEEFPEGRTIVDANGNPMLGDDGKPMKLEPLYFRNHITESGPEMTQLTVDHRAFGPNGMDLQYMVSVTSSIKSATQNCLYPGRGPAPVGRGVSGADGAHCSVVRDAQGNITSISGCIPAVDAVDASQDTGCAQNDPSIPLTTADLSACQNSIRNAVTQ